MGLVNEIETYPFDEACKQILSTHELGKDWPVVYVLNNKSQMYIGETSSIYNRLSQHLKNPEKEHLQKVNVIFDREFNKSAVLDIEQALIHLSGADNKYELLNLNAGQSVKHNYYQREKYINKIETIWSDFQKIGLAQDDYKKLVNSKLFKYSPYMTLTEEQSQVCYSVINDIIDKLSNNQTGTSVIHGSAGTGKTIVGINIIFTIINAMKIKIDPSIEPLNYSEEQKTIRRLQEFVQKRKNFKVAYVMPMTSIRKTITNVFTDIKNGLESSMVIGPTYVIKEPYDVLLVDESHRLTTRNGTVSMKTFDDVCKKLGLDPKKSSQLDWVVMSSPYKILFYDESQSIKGLDISHKRFVETLKKENVLQFWLSTQMRCTGGNTYIDYIDKIFKCEQVESHKINNYDFRLFDDIKLMENEIRQKNQEMGLCRLVAGYSWKWISKKFKPKDAEKIKKEGYADIRIQGHEYVWNMSSQEFMLRPESIDEVGCVHTVQGYDGNIMGVIFGSEIDYDPSNNRITIDLRKFYDTKVKRETEETLVKKYVINAYKVMLSRGIKGTYLFACNNNLREYLRKFVKE